MNRNKRNKMVLFKKRVKFLKKFNKVAVRYYTNIYGLNKSNFMFKKYYDIFFKIHFIFFKKIKIFYHSHLISKLFFSKIILNNHKYYYGNVDKYSPKYEPQIADQYFLKLTLKKMHNKTYFNYSSSLKSNVFLLTDNYLILDKNNYQMGSYFFKTSLNYQYFYENEEYDTYVLFENFNFLFLFKYNLLYSLEIYKLHCNILLKFIK